MAGEPVNVNEFEELAREALPKMNYDYFRGGAEDQHTLRENVAAFQRITFRPRVLVDVSSIDMSTSILGYKIPAPIVIAPTGMHELAHPQGEVATARAAAASNTIMVLSFSSSRTIEEVASSSQAVRFYQLYVSKRRDIAAALVQRAERNGFKAIVLTADTQRLGRRELDIKNKMAVPPLRNLEGLISTDVDSAGGSGIEAFVAQFKDSSLNWKDIEWLRSVTNLPILIKGVLTAEDGQLMAFTKVPYFSFLGEKRGQISSVMLLVMSLLARKAVEVGVEGVIVSNHGARQLDYSPATITVLEEVVQAVKGKVPVIFDGGIRRGTDVFKALALGAKAVMVGRPVIYGLATRGEAGVVRVMQMLKDELELTMALAGCPTLKDITRRHVTTESDRLRSSL